MRFLKIEEMVSDFEMWAGAVAGSWHMEHGVASPPRPGGSRGVCGGCAPEKHCDWSNPPPAGCGHRTDCWYEVVYVCVQCYVYVMTMVKADMLVDMYLALDTCSACRVACQGN